MIYLSVSLLLFFIGISINLYIKQVRYLNSIKKLYNNFINISLLLLVLELKYQFYNDDNVDRLMIQLILMLKLLLLFLLEEER